MTLYRQSFYATEAALNFVMMACNFIRLFRQAVFKQKIHQQMKTRRRSIFAIGGYIVKSGSRRILKLSLAMKRREWFTGLWMNTHSIHAPLTFSFY